MNCVLIALACLFSYNRIRQVSPFNMKGGSQTALHVEWKLLAEDECPQACLKV